MSKAARNKQLTASRKQPPLFWRVLKWTALGLFSFAVTVFTIAFALVFHKIDPPTLLTDPVAAMRLEAELKQAETTATTDSPQAITVEEGALNSILQSRLSLIRSQIPPDTSLTMRNVRLQFTGDRMHAYVVLDVYGKDLTIDLQGKIRSDGGFLKFTPISAKIGALSVPKSTLQSAMVQMMATPENREQFRLPPNLSDLRVEGGHLVVTFK
jgi:hypothetical protein